MKGGDYVCAGSRDLPRFMELYNLRVDRNPHVQDNILYRCIQGMDSTDNQAPALDWFNIQGQESSNIQ